MLRLCGGFSYLYCWKISGLLVFFFCFIGVLLEVVVWTETPKVLDSFRFDRWLAKSQIVAPGVFSIDFVPMPQSKFYINLSQSTFYKKRFGSRAQSPLSKVNWCFRDYTILRGKARRWQMPRNSRRGKCESEFDAEIGRSSSYTDCQCHVCCKILGVSTMSQIYLWIWNRRRTCELQELG